MCRNVQGLIENESMAAFSEIKALQEEKKTLLSIASELNAQLQRLKIEELALMSLAKLEEERTRTGAEEYAEVTAVTKCRTQGDENTDMAEDNTELETLDLSVSQNPAAMQVEEEEEEEEESEEEPDQLTMFMNDLAHRTSQGSS